MTMLANFVLETASSPGVGDFVLNGAVADRNAFSQAFPSGGRVFYFADDGAQAEWGVGTLTVANPCSLARSRVIGNTQGGTDPVRFSGGVQVYNEVPAEFLALLDETGRLNLEYLTVTTEALVPVVTDWNEQQVVGAADADGRYVRQYSASGQTPVSLLTMLGGGSLAAYSNGAWYSLQPKGDYATTVQVNTAQSSANSAQGTANSALQAANSANSSKLDATGGTATGLTINYGTKSAAYQSDGNFVLYQGGKAFFSINDSAINWNGHGFVFTDDLPTEPGQKIVMDVATGVSAGGRVTFAVPFSDTPKVMAQNFGDGDANCHAYAPDKNGFSLHINNGGSSDITYIAIGPK